MKKIFQFAFIFLLGSQAFGQMILKVPGFTPDKACKPDSVYFLMSDKGKPVESYDSINARLIRSVPSLKNNPTLKASVALQCVINCKGEPGGALHIVDKSGNESIDNELIAFIRTIKKYKTGKYKGQPVDSWFMWRVEIANGKIQIGNRWQ